VNEFSDIPVYGVNKVKANIPLVMALESYLNSLVIRDLFIGKFNTLLEARKMLVHDSNFPHRIGLFLLK